MKKTKEISLTFDGKVRELSSSGFHLCQLLVRKIDTLIGENKWYAEKYIAREDDLGNIKLSAIVVLVD